MFAEGDLFSAPVFGYPPFPNFLAFFAKRVFKQLPKWTILTTKINIEPQLLQLLLLLLLLLLKLLFLVQNRAREGGLSGSLRIFR